MSDFSNKTMAGPLFVGIDGLTLTAAEKQLLQHPLISGVILFRRNYQDRAQLQALTTSIKAVKTPALLVCVDQEGGRVQRFCQGFTKLAPMARLGALYDSDAVQARQLAQAVGYVLAFELLSCGVDFSFTPVLDTQDDRSAVIGDRSFHANPNVIAELGLALQQGMRQLAMPAVAKHFPGHGGVVEDSHLEKPYDQRYFSQIWQHDLVPFQSLMADSLSGVMASHVCYSKIDSRSAGFSNYWLQLVLRQQMQFKGVIFSDDLGMAGAGTSEHSRALTALERVRTALQAGCDIALLCNERDAVLQVIAGLEPLGQEALRPDLFERLQPFYGRDQKQNAATYQARLQQVREHDLCEQV